MDGIADLGGTGRLGTGAPRRPRTNRCFAEPWEGRGVSR